MEEVCFSRMQSRIFFPPDGVLYANKPPAAMSRSRAEVMSKPTQKMCKDTSSGKGLPGLIAKRRANLAHAAPRDSFSNYSNARMSLHGEGIRDKGENKRQKSSQSLPQSPFTFPPLWVYHCSVLSVIEKGNNFHLKVSYVMPGLTRHDIVPRTLENDHGGLHLRLQRSVVPEPSQCN
jgi:hypothetical protein